MTNSPDTAGPVVTTRWAVGSWSGIVAPDGVCMVPGSVSQGLVDELWTLLHQPDGSITAVLNRLVQEAGGSLADIPDIALVTFGPDGTRVALRGVVQLELDGERFVAGEVTTWLESHREHVSHLAVIAPGEPKGTLRPVADAVVPAAQIVVDLSEPRVGGAQARSGVKNEANSKTLSPTGGSPAEPTAAPAPQSADRGVRPASVPVQDVPPRALSVPTRKNLAQVSSPESASLKTPPTGPPSGPWEGETQGHGADEKLAQPNDNPPVSPVADTPNLPWEGEQDGQEGLSEATVLVDAGDHDGWTIASLPGDFVGVLRNLSRKRGAPGPGRDQPDALEAATELCTVVDNGRRVLSAICAEGHPNPTNYLECRVCGSKLQDSARMAPRPALGRMRTSSGEVIELDRSVLVGRCPSSANVPEIAGREVRMVEIPNEDRTISRNHLLIELEEWSVLARDLSTGNGTILRREGSVPMRLSSTDPVLLRDGDILDLGQGQTLSLEDLP